jgi:glycosyl transferase, family 25
VNAIVAARNNVSETGATGLDAIYVLNVRAFGERLRSITAQLAAFGLTAEIIQDWDTADITADVAARWFVPEALTPAQRSCALKHVEALQRISARGQKHALVLEDDALLAPDFVDGIRRALAEAGNYSEASVIFIGSGGNFYTPRSQRQPGRSLYPGPRGRFADSYIIGHAAAGKRLAWIEEHRIAQPMDNQFETIDRDTGIAMLWLEDPVVEQGSKNGRFVTAIDKQHPRWLQWLQFHFEKLRRKWLYQLWR